MPETQITQAVQLLDLMLEHFAEDRHWTRGRYDDGNGGHCLRRSSTSEPQASPVEGSGDYPPAGCDASPGLPLVHFNDICCDSIAELRSIVLKARHLADDYAEQERAAAAAKAWLFAQIEKKRRPPSEDNVGAAPDEPCAPERLAA